MRCSRATRTTLTADREDLVAAPGDQEAEAAGLGADSPTGLFALLALFHNNVNVRKFQIMDSKKNYIKSVTTLKSCLYVP